jgi:hypothetical protein
MAGYPAVPSVAPYRLLLTNSMNAAAGVTLASFNPGVTAFNQGAYPTATGHFNAAAASWNTQATTLNPFVLQIAQVETQFIEEYYNWIDNE